MNINTFECDHLYDSFVLFYGAIQLSLYFTLLRIVCNLYDISYVLTSIVFYILRPHALLRMLHTVTDEIAWSVRRSVCHDREP